MLVTHRVHSLYLNTDTVTVIISFLLNSSDANFILYICSSGSGTTSSYVNTTQSVPSNNTLILLCVMVVQTSDKLSVSVQKFNYFKSYRIMNY